MSTTTRAPRLEELSPGMVVESEDGLYWLVDRRTATGVRLAARPILGWRGRSTVDGRPAVALTVAQLGYITDWDAA